MAAARALRTGSALAAASTPKGPSVRLPVGCASHAGSTRSAARTVDRDVFSGLPLQRSCVPQQGGSRSIRSDGKAGQLPSGEILTKLVITWPVRVRRWRHDLIPQLNHEPLHRPPADPRPCHRHWRSRHRRRRARPFTAPTRCPEMDVRAMLSHLVGVLDRIAALEGRRSLLRDRDPRARPQLVRRVGKVGHARRRRVARRRRARTTNDTAVDPRKRRRSAEDPTSPS